jgi:hypothetical protein
MPLVIKLTLRAVDPVKVFIRCDDASRRNTTYTNRYNTIQGIEEFLIRMPLSPELSLITIVNEDGDDDGFNLVAKEVLPIKTQMSAFDFGKPGISKFVVFAQFFAERAGYLSPGEYFNETGEYKITYLSEIVSHTNSKVLNTPARISANSGLVEVSKSKFDKYTVPGRLAVLLHEFCHIFVNKDISSETEADKHAATIYLGLGYPRIDLLNVFANIFYRADTDVNRKRMSLFIKYVNDFDNKIFSVKYA